jgi:putative colanic acid biosynthesis acetyltransferase WcaF
VNPNPQIERKLNLFDRSEYDKGRNFLVQGIWFLVLNVFFVKWWFPRSLRPVVLRIFGAKVGENVFIRHRVRIMWPWKLVIGNNCWLGEDLWILNLEKVSVGNDVCLSQNVKLCTGSHDYKSKSFNYRNAPITIEDGVWLAIDTLVLPGVTIGRGVTVLARSTIKHNIKRNQVIRKDN